MPDLVLRDYQSAAVQSLRDAIRGGVRTQLLVAPTGAGKTACATYLMDAARKKETKVAFVVDRVNLVDQTSAALDQYNIPHGVIQANHWRRRGYEHIQVCSAQTLEKRGFFPELSLLVVDEAHIVRKETAKLIGSMDRLKVIGLTATPFTKGLASLYQHVVNVSTTDELTAHGFLVPVKIYAAIAPDMAGARIVAGEWAEQDIEQRGLKIIGNIVSEWVDKTSAHFGGPVKTIVFSATVNHGEELCRQFSEAGFNFQQISYKDKSDDRRRELIAEFRKPDSEIMGLVSCEVLGRGFDVPDVLCGISARPYRKSFSSHIQQLGRVLRPAPGKDFALWLCHSGNSLRFYDDQVLLFANGVHGLSDAELDAKTRKEPEIQDSDHKCKGCGFVLPPGAEVCPACGKERKRRVNVQTGSGTMVLIGGRQVPAVGKHAFLADPDRVWPEIVGFCLDWKHGDMIAAGKMANAQFRSLYGRWPSRRFADTAPAEPSAQVYGMVKHGIIRYAKARANG